MSEPHNRKNIFLLYIFLFLTDSTFGKLKIIVFLLLFVFGFFCDRSSSECPRILMYRKI